MNAIRIIHPYKEQGVWVFDDENYGLVKEPFVSGMSEIIDDVVERNMPCKVDEGFNMIFSDQPFPGIHATLTKLRPEFGGNWYSLDGGMEGWLCPALFHYFDEAPEKIYVKVGLK